ncbi:hypothetical protein J132_08109 [Termitomyces sp. J132]|nr:hypothetical protein H2248_004108 [Termitomyces sp. 'cryptogamus']KNZ71598.1 hypothetical protein J132_08109 [Termitomyces sp. J132]
MYWPPQYAYYYPPTPYPPHLVTPCIPDLTLYPPSPYSNSGCPNRRLPSDPTTPNTPSIALPPTGPWDGCRRERRLSFQGFNPGNLWPDTAQQYLNVANVPRRRHSFGHAVYQPPYLWPGLFTPPYLWQGLFTPLLIDPCINAESPCPDFFFDLSPPIFQPMQLSHNGQSRLLLEGEMTQHATSPPVTRMKIVFDEFPCWPCCVSRDPLFTITLLDVLIEIHRHVHTQITMEDFAGLSSWGQAQVAQAFTKRCDAIPDNSVEERARGVKRVDYLLGKTRLVGLLHRGHEDGWALMKVVTL